MKHLSPQRAVVIALLFGAGSAPLAGQAPGQLLESTLKARRIVRDAVAAIGGPAALNGLQEVEVTYQGHVYAPTQSYDPNAPTRPSPATLSIILDDRDDAFYQSIDSPPPGMTGPPSPIFYRDSTVFTTNGGARNYSAAKGPPPPQRDGASRFVAPVVLQVLMRNLRSATYAGDDVVDGRPAEVIDFTWSDRRFRAVFDRADHSLRAIRFVGPDPVVGDDEPAVEFSGARTEAGLRFPTHVVWYQAGVPFLDLDLADLRVNQPFDSAKFAVPAGFVETPAAPPAVTTTRLDEGLYEVSGVGGGYRSQFIDVGDGVVVFEAPFGRPATRTVAAEIRKTLGPKPVKYVVISHFHDDHAAGVGVYGDAGATIVTVKGNEDILTRYARAGSALMGIPPHPALQLHFLDLTGNVLDLPTGARKLVVYRIDGVPHVKDLLVLYDPQTRTIINGDLFTTFFSPSSPSYRRFAEWLQAPGAPEVARIAGVHHPPMTKQAFLDAVLPGGR